MSTIYESPIDLTICAASSWTGEERAKSPSKSETSESHISQADTDSTPRPRTVIISHHNHSHRASVGMSREEDEEKRTFDKYPYGNEQDVSFLMDFRKAIIEEDHRIGEILKKKDRFFVTF